MAEKNLKLTPPTVGHRRRDAGEFGGDDGAYSEHSYLDLNTLLAVCLDFGAQFGELSLKHANTMIQTENVGSLPRPAYLQDAFAEYDAGKITKHDLLKVQDAAVKDTINRLEGTGQDLVTDGEQRSSGFMAGEIDKEKLFQEIGANLGSDADGVKQVAFIGVVNTLDPRVESPEEIRDVLLLAAKYIPEDQLGATDDCGSSPFSIDYKPKYGGADYAREIAFMKIANRVKGVALANECLDNTRSGTQQ
ncbi:hypothetical protein IFR05_001005 [Cadophora sp. M221]|nr:hypothetical protein IFR05_001005 [Cadophora sp. M221]